MASQKLILCVFLLTLHSALSFICPPVSLEPCVCDGDTVSISCQGEVTHEHLRHVFELSRTVNLVPQFHWLNITTFTLTQTNISSLDIRFLANHTSITNLIITGNSQLTDVILPSGPWPWRSQAANVNLSSNLIRKDGLYVMLSLFDESVKSLDLSFNQIEGFSGREIVDGIGFLTELEYLNLNNNLLTILNASPFIHNNRLIELDLSNNKIGEVGRNTFEFEEAEIDQLDVTLTINLNGNRLTDGQISAESGLAGVGRPMQLYLENNNFVFISAPNFESYLYVDFTNGLHLAGNHFICDERMKYLKDARELLEERVLNVDCQNDPGYTIFTTDRV